MPEDKIKWIAPEQTNQGNSVTGGAVVNIDPSQYNFQAKINADNNKLRAQNQSGVKQAGLMLANGAANTLTTMAEGFGYLPELFDNDRDYSNAFTQKMQEWKNPFGEIYRENPEETFDLADPAWWYSNIQQLGESVAAFGMMNVGTAKVFGTIARGAGEALTLGRLGATGKRIADGAAMLAGASTQAYVEGAMSGYRIYDEVYNEQRRKNVAFGMSLEEAEESAKKSAAEAAATTVKTNVILNTVLNLGEFAPLFKNPTDEVLDFYRTTGKRQAGESMSQWRKRLSEMEIDNPEVREALKLRKGWYSYGAESFKEGIEEVNTQYAEERGKRAGKGEIDNALFDLDQYLSDVSNQEGALNFLLGSVGGVGTTVLMDNVPVRYTTYDKESNQTLKLGADGKVQYDANGKPVYEKYLVSSRTLNERGQRKYFENIKDAIVEDIDRYDKLQKQLIEATANKNEVAADAIRAEIFQIGAMNAVSKGMTENWIQEYESIADIDNEKSLGEQLTPQIEQLRGQIMEAEEAGQDATELKEAYGQLMQKQMEMADVTEAVQKGLAKDKDDNQYKERARTAARQLKELQKIHDSVQTQFKMDDTPVAAELADHVFFRKADLYLRGEALKNAEKRLEEAEAQERKINFSDSDAFYAQLEDHNRHVNAWKEVRDRLNNDIERLKKADEKGDIETIKELVQKYRGTPIEGDEMMTKAIDQLIKRIQGEVNRYNQSMQTSEQQLADGIGFSTWKESNPNGTLQEYVASVEDNIFLRQQRANLQELKSQYKIAEQNLQEITSVKGVSNLQKALAEDRKKLVESVNARNRNANVEAFLKHRNAQSAAALDVREKEVLIAKFEAQLAEKTQEYNKKSEEVEQLQREYDSYLKTPKSLLQNGLTLARLNQSIKAGKKDLAVLQAEIDYIKSQLDMLQVVKEQAEVKQEFVAQQEEAPETYEPTPVPKTPDAPPTVEEPAETPRPALDYNKAVGNVIMQAVARNSENGRELTDTEVDLITNAFDKIEMKFVNGGYTSLQEYLTAFTTLIGEDILSQQEVMSVFPALRNAVEERIDVKQKPEEATQPPSTEPAPVQQETPGIDPTDIAQPEESEQPVININVNLVSEQGLADAYWENVKSVNTGAKVNTANLQYMEIKKSNGTAVIRNVTVNYEPQIDPNTNQQTMVPGAIKVGDEVELRIDPNWNGEINYDEVRQDEFGTIERKADSFDMYLKNGKIDTSSPSEYSYANVPIQIVHSKSGQVIGYLGRHGWVNNERNTVPGEDGDNLLVQSTINLAIRKKLANLWNQKGNDAKLTTRISERGDGHLLSRAEANPNTGKVNFSKAMISAKNALPDQSLMFGVHTADGFQTGFKESAAVRGIELSKSGVKLYRDPITNEPKANLRGVPFVLLPMPNGTHYPAFLETKQLSADKKADGTLPPHSADVYTIERALEIYVIANNNFKGQKYMPKVDLDEIADMEFKEVGVRKSGDVVLTLNHYHAAMIKKHTGFDITSPEGLRDFLEQYYTHVTRSFKDEVMNASPEAMSEEVKQEFHLAIPNSSTGLIKIGTTYTPGSLKVAKIEIVDGNPRLDHEFLTTLRGGLAGRFKNVAFTKGNVKGVNDQRPITTVSIRQNGVVSTQNFKNYNEYLKSFTYTSVYGKHMVDGKYVYGANSTMTLDHESLIQGDSTAAELIDAPAPDVIGTTAPVESDLQSDLDELMFNNIVPVDRVQYIVKAPGDPLTLENLQNLANLATAMGNRNSKSVDEVYNYLSRLGIASIADGYNPFMKC
jgi:hypothetical protein